MINHKYPTERFGRNVLICLAALGCTLLSPLAMSDSLNQDQALSLRRQGVILPLEQFIEQALGGYPGSKLLEAQLEEKHNVLVYQIELLTADHVVRALKFNARDSRLLQDKEAD
jgi:uncharacterized membrane protein YkoI